MYPVKNPRITQLFGENPQMYAQFGMNGHNGVDFGIPVGTEIFAVRDENIRQYFDGDHTGYGLYLRGTGSGKEDTYGHLSQVLKTGDVKKGDVIALSGNSGFSTGPHLHYGLRYLDGDGNVINYDNGFKGSVDPLPFLKEEEFNMDLFHEFVIEIFRTWRQKAFGSVDNPSCEADAKLAEDLFRQNNQYGGSEQIKRYFESKQFNDLWLKKVDCKPQIITKTIEVPKEVIKEVPVEKEVVVYRDNPITPHQAASALYQAARKWIASKFQWNKKE